MKKYSKLPWNVVKNRYLKSRIVSKENGYICDILGNINYETREQDAKFIVKCVNSHNKLINNKKYLKKQLYLIEGILDNEISNDEKINQIREILENC